MLSNLEKNFRNKIGRRTFDSLLMSAEYMSLKFRNSFHFPSPPPHSFSNYDEDDDDDADDNDHDHDDNHDNHHHRHHDNHQNVIERH